MFLYLHLHFFTSETTNLHMNTIPAITQRDTIKTKLIQIPALKKTVSEELT